MLESLKNIFLPQKWGQLPADRGAADTAKTPKNCFSEEQIEVHVQRSDCPRSNQTTTIIVLYLIKLIPNNYANLVLRKLAVEAWSN